MAKLTNYQLSLDNSTWIDVNTLYGQNGLPDRVSDAQAIISASLYNLFNCVPGQRARTFEPTYGSYWLQFIHEPISDITAAKMEIFMLSSIKKWEPRIVLDTANSSITANTNIPGYVVRIAFSIPSISSPQQVQFQVQL
jgi:phage baseplate assembly protein W